MGAVGQMGSCWWVWEMPMAFRDGLSLVLPWSKAFKHWLNWVQIWGLVLKSCNLSKKKTLFPHRSGDSNVSFLKDKSIDCYSMYSCEVIKEHSKYIESINAVNETEEIASSVVCD